MCVCVCVCVYMLWYSDSNLVRFEILLAEIPIGVCTGTDSNPIGVCTSSNSN